MLAPLTDALQPQSARFYAKTQCAIPKLASVYSSLDLSLGGGLSFGHITEWGAAWGKGGRRGLLPFLAEATRRGLWCLWASDRADVSIYPPSWHAHGVKLNLLRVAHLTASQDPEQSPVEQLKPIFFSPFFKMIILDCRIWSQEHAFLAQRAEREGLLIILVRSYRLSSYRGNVRARYRLNCWHDPLGHKQHFQLIKGWHPQHLLLDEKGWE